MLRELHMSHDIFPCLIIDLLLTEQLAPVCIGNGSDHAAGIAGCDRPGGDILGDNASGSDDGVACDGYAGTDDGIAANPDVVPDGYGFSVLIAGVAGDGIDGVTRSVDRYIGGQLAVVADGNLCHIDDGTVVVESQ